MTTPELINYLKKQLAKKIPRNTFIAKLKAVGWKESDIEEGLSEASKKITDIDQAQGTTPTDENINRAKPFFSKPLTKVNSSFLYTPTIPSINTQINSTNSDNKELIPNLIPKNNSNNFISNKDKKDKTSEVIEKTESPDGFFTEEISTQKIKEQAMLASFPRDSMKENNYMKHKTSASSKIFRIIFSRKSILILIIIFLGIGIYIANKIGYIKLPNLNNINIQSIENLVINKPKDLLANSPSFLASVLSYKSETKIVITAPMKINYLDYSDKDLEDKKNVTSIQIESEIDQKGLSTQSANGLFTIQSNSFIGNLVTNIKSNGSVLFVPLSEFNQFVMEKKSGDGFVAINENDYLKLKEMLTNDFQESARSINIHKLLKESLSANLNRIIVRSFEEYIENLSVEGEKAEKILGIDTYKYNILNNPTVTQKFFSEIANFFALNSQAETSMKETAKLITVDAFDVWIDQENKNLFKFKIVFNIPMTSLARTGDTYPSGSYANFDWQTTYTDFGVMNQIEMPYKIINFSELIREPEINLDPSVIEEESNTLD